MITLVGGIGAVIFGLVIGWISYRSLRQTAGTTTLSNIAIVVGAVGGAAVTLLKSDVLFGWYCIGLVLGFFAYFGYTMYAQGRQGVLPWRLISPSLTPAPVTPPVVSPTDGGEAQAEDQATSVQDEGQAT